MCVPVGGEGCAAEGAGGAAGARAARVSRGSSLEEGEVSDEAERRPEESEPRPVCRFFSRGACTWGVSCRSSYTLLHTDVLRPSIYYAI